jgi:hypothetical protein
MGGQNLYRPRASEADVRKRLPHRRPVMEIFDFRLAIFDLRPAIWSI